MIQQAQMHILEEIVWIFDDAVVRSNELFKSQKWICLVASLHGKLSNCDSTALFSDVFSAARRAHGRKPDELYHLIESLWPNGDYLELFGRVWNLRPQWTTMGCFK